MKLLKVSSHKFFFFYLFFVVQWIHAQNGASVVLSGSVTVDAVAVEAVNVNNVSKDKTTTTNAKGVFTLEVNEGDVLVFSAVNLVTLQKRITKEDVKAGSILISMSTNSIALQEVIINEDSQITATHLGIVSADQKRYTPAERKLYTARSGLLDRPLNWISGRTAELKKGVIVEKNLRALERLEYLFEDKYYIETLKIHKDYIKGFQYYCIEDAEFVSALESKNKTLCMFLIITLAKKYNKITVYEN
ncbi:hypothetical protein [Flavobacterium sp.]|uniref:hypothetical protein n=1 Tax=Flavobacterium sp. TaxID=239 RepID=UPI002634D847|nr:hypothetical protein [Flavobacterium sp.]MDG2433425.1 hypothetical protein [Flavobacterium sp.]